MSRRVHSIIEEEALALERYSIDEAFGALPDLSRENLSRLADRLRRRVLAERKASPSPFIGANLFGLSGDDFRVESHLQQENKQLRLAGRVGHRNWGDAVRKNRGVVWLVH